MAYGVNAPFGLKPLYSLLGGNWTEKLNMYIIDHNYESPIFTGDPVMWGNNDTNEGEIELYSYNQHGAVVSTSNNVQKTSTNNTLPVLGVFQGCEYTLSSGELVKSPYWPGGTIDIMSGTRVRAYVLDDPYIVYDIQVSTCTNVLEEAIFGRGSVGSNFGICIGGDDTFTTIGNPPSGSKRTGQSAAFLVIKFNNATPPATTDPVTTYTATDIPHDTPTLPLKVIGYTLNPQNTGADQPNPGAFVNVRVIINNHAYKAGTVGANV